MVKVSGPLFSMAVSGNFGGIIFDRRGYACIRRSARDARTPGQGNYRLALTVAQKCASACGPATRQQVKALSPEPARWSPYLVQQLIGPQSQSFLAWPSLPLPASIRPVGKPRPCGSACGRFLSLMPNTARLRPAPNSFYWRQRCSGWGCIPTWGGLTATLTCGRRASVLEG